MSYEHNNLFAYLTNKEWVEEDALGIVKAYEAAKTMDNKALVNHITEHNLTWEMLPTESLRDIEIWRAMFPNMPATALLRNLGRLTRLDLLKPLSDEAIQAAAKFNDSEWVKQGRLHPFNILLAYYTYTKGRGRSDADMYRHIYREQKPDWTPVQAISDSLESAFESSFQNVDATGKRMYVAVDVSSSMSSQIMGTPMSAAEGAAALALYIAKTEPNYHIASFSSGSGYSGRSRTSVLEPMKFTAKSSLTDVLLETKMKNFGGTDCSLPMLDAIQKKLPVDCFVILTDSETRTGSIHPATALQKYRVEMNRPAKLVVVAMTSNGFSIADPKDAGMMDMAGFDAAMPRIISDFVTN